MEEQVFLKDSVYPRLKKDFVEARLHMDGPLKLGEKKHNANLALQKKYSNSVALPTFVIVDPKTRKSLGTIRGLKAPQVFLDFLSAGEAKVPGRGEKVGKTH